MLHPIAKYGSFLQYWHSARYVPLYMKLFCLNLALCTWLYWVSSHWKTTLHSCPSLQFLFPQVGVILKSDDHALCSIISAIKHSFETANASDPCMAILQCPWRVTANPWLTLMKRASSVRHAPTFSNCICGIFVYCGYKNVKWNSTKTLTKIKMNPTNSLQPQGWLPCQRKEAGWFDGMHYLRVCAGCFYSLLSTRSILSVDWNWADGYVISRVHLFSAF